MSVNQLVEKTVEFLQHTFPKNITVLTDLMANPDTITGDPEALRQALINVCVNSRDAMPGGGNITITTKNAINESLAYKLGNDRIIDITVIDNGEGFDDTVSNRIFEPFFTTRRDAGHSGLGMSTTFAIILKHSGLIEVNSRKDDGTKVHIFLPESITSDSILDADNPESDTVNIDTKNQTILIVDDESSVLSMLHRIFKREGCNVLEADDGFKALKIVEKYAQKINLIVLDMVMPHLDGKETFLHIRELYPDIPILLSSGYQLNHEIQELTKFKSTYFIHKPYQRATILKIAKQILSKKVNTSV
jgi:CheY-like chemotaxis protein